MQLHHGIAGLSRKKSDRQLLFIINEQNSWIDFQQYSVYE